MPKKKTKKYKLLKLPLDDTSTKKISFAETPQGKTVMEELSKTDPRWKDPVFVDRMIRCILRVHGFKC